MVEFGKRIYPKRQVKNSEICVRGSHWSIKLVDQEYVFEYVSGSHGGGVSRHVVSREDFEAVRSGDLTDLDLLNKYDLN